SRPPPAAVPGHPRRAPSAGRGCAAAPAAAGAVRQCVPRAPRGLARPGRAGGTPGPSEIGPDAEIELERGVGVVQAVGDVEPHRADRRAPANPRPDPGMPVRLAVEGTAAVHEHRRAPLLGEVALELHAGGGDLLRAQCVELAVRPLVARADLAPREAADAAVAAAEEAQAGRHRLL